MQNRETPAPKQGSPATTAASRVRAAWSDWLDSWRAATNPAIAGRDLLAGFTVAAVALPLNLALAVASGLPPSAGLVAGAIGGILAGVFGGAPLQITGPAAALNVMVLHVVKDYGVVGAAAAALITGAIQVLLSSTRAGQIVRQVPEAVLSGFTTGVGLKLLDNQLPELLGFDYRVFELAQMMHRPAWLHKVSWLAVVCGLFVAFFVTTMSRFRRFPAALVGIGIITFVSSYLGWDIERVGAIPSSFPPLTMPVLPDERWLDLVLVVLPIALLASVESLLSANALDRLSHAKKPHNPSLELFGQGIANIGVGLLCGMPVTGVVVRSSVNVQSGGTTRLSSIVHGVVLMLAVLYLSNDISRIPLAALAGLLCVIAVRLIEVHTLVELAKTERASALAFVVTAAGTLSGHLVTGLGLGLAIYFVANYFLRGKERALSEERLARPHGIRAVLSREAAQARRPAIYEPRPKYQNWLSNIRERAAIPHSAFVHPQATVIGRVILSEHVHIAAGSSVRADEGSPFFIGANTNIQDGVVIHALKDKHVQVGSERWAVFIGEDVSLAHNALIHGPCYIGDETFIGFKAVIHDSVVGAHCFVGIGAVVVGVEVPDGKFVPHGAIIDSPEEVARLRDVSASHAEFNEDVVEVNRGLASAYHEHSRSSGRHHGKAVVPKHRSYIHRDSSKPAVLWDAQWDVHRDRNRF